MVDTTRRHAPPKCAEKDCLETLSFGASGSEDRRGGRFCAKHKEPGRADLMVRSEVFEETHLVRVMC